MNPDTKYTVDDYGISEPHSINDFLAIGFKRLDVVLMTDMQGANYFLVPPEVANSRPNGLNDNTEVWMPVCQR